MDTRPFSKWAWVRGYSPWGNHKIMSDYGNFLSKQHILPHFARGATFSITQEGTQTVPKYLKEPEGEHRLKPVILASTLMKQHQYQRGDKYIRCWGSNSTFLWQRMPALSVCSIPFAYHKSTETKNSPPCWPRNYHPCDRAYRLVCSHLIAPREAQIASACAGICQSWTGLFGGSAILLWKQPK